MNKVLKNKYFQKNYQYVPSTSRVTSKRAKNDEFYTKYKDVEAELKNYMTYFKDATIYCPCDTKDSNIYKYLKDNFFNFGIKEVIASSYCDGGKGTLCVFDGAETTAMLCGDGDFKSDEVKSIASLADIIVTNPPFSKFDSFYSFLKSIEKKFIVMGTYDKAVQLELFEDIKYQKTRTGFTYGKVYFDSFGEEKPITNVAWYTNFMDVNPLLKPINTCQFDASIHKKLDNYDAIRVNSLHSFYSTSNNKARFPADYDGVMSVNISYLLSWDRNEYELIGKLQNGSKKNPYDLGKAYYAGKRLYTQLLIKKKGGEELGKTYN